MSLRNALHRRNHKERAQLTGRSRLGLLEKKKDYVQRAKDYHSKQERIHRLQEKAAMRNKDEFYFSMINSRTKGGVHIQERGNAAIPVDTVKILKSQDENYIRTIRAAGLKRIAALKLELSNLINLLPSSQSPGELDVEGLDENELQTFRSVGLISSSSAVSASSKKNRAAENDVHVRGTHVVFVGNQDEAQKYRPPSGSTTTQTTGNSTTDNVEGDAVDLGWKNLDEISSTSTKQRRKRMANSHTHPEPQGDASQRQRLEIATANRKLLIAELSARLERDASLKDALLEIKNQRLRMQNGAKRLIDKTLSSPADRSDGTSNINTAAEDDSNDADEDPRHSNSEGKWKPKVYKWKFQRKR